jgi:hypothetical protein
MTAALKPSGYPPRRRRSMGASAQAHANSPAQLNRVNRDLRHRDLRHRTEAEPSVREFPAPQPQPRWLQVLLSVQQVSSVLSVGLIAGLLGTYGWSVTTQEQWSQAFERLQGLQKQEQQLLLSNETLKNQLAQDAEQGNSGLIEPTIDSMVFVPQATARPLAEPEDIPDVEPIPVKPLGY